MPRFSGGFDVVYRVPRSDHSPPIGDMFPKTDQSPHNMVIYALLAMLGIFFTLPPSLSNSLPYMTLELTTLNKMPYFKISPFLGIVEM